jgi:hypothetical protein
MRRTILTLFTVLSISLVFASPSMAAVKPGAPCAKKNQTIVQSNRIYTCVLLKKKLIWNGGKTLLTKPSPSPSPSNGSSLPAQASPTPQPVVTVTVTAEPALDIPPVPTGFSVEPNILVVTFRWAGTWDTNPNWKGFKALEIWMSTTPNPSGEDIRLVGTFTANLRAHAMNVSNGKSCEVLYFHARTQNIYNQYGPLHLNVISGKTGSALGCKN